MNRANIKYLTRDAARLLLILLTASGTERIGDLLHLIELAGLQGREYEVAFAELRQLGFVEVRDGQIVLLVES